MAFMILLAGLPISGCLMGEEETIDDHDEVSIISEAVTYLGSDYLFVTTPKTWAAAQTYCASYDQVGGTYHLVIINDINEENFLDANEVAREKSNWWIGYSDSGTEGNWLWSNGSSAYSNWEPGQPDNNHNQDCAADRSGISNQWSDLACGTANVFICERESGAPARNDGSFSYTASATASATLNAVQFPVYLNKEQIFTLGTCGVTGASGSGDTWLRLKNPSGGEVASNNDSGGDCGTLSNISIVAATAGTYVIHAGCNGDSACSGTITFNYFY